MYDKFCVQTLELAIFSKCNAYYNKKVPFNTKVVYIERFAYADIRNAQTFILRLLTECFILVGSVMFGATFNLVTRVGLP